MMKYNKIRSIVLAMGWALVPVMGSAQNLNPVVEVSKSYVGKLSETRKPIETMAVPDSLMRFDLDFDYSVFDNPYRGAYIFSPYVVDIKPQKIMDWNRKFYFSAGAGYALRPELDLLWSPKVSDRFKLNVYATGRSYMGNYKNVSTLADPDASAQAGPGQGNYQMASTHQGYDFASRAGVNGWWDWRTGRMLFDVAYRGLHTKDSLLHASYNALDLQLRFHSNQVQRPHFYYDASVRFNFGSDHIAPVGEEVPGRSPLQMEDPTRFMNLELYGTLGKKSKGAGSFMMDYEMGFYGTNVHDASIQVGKISATPKYLWKKNRLDISAGLEVSYIFHSQDNIGILGKTETQYVYPDIYLGYDLIRDHLNVFLKVDGGDHLQNYNTLKERNHFFNFASYRYPVISNTVDMVNMALGLRGNISQRLQYNAMGGFKLVNNGLIDGVFDNGFSAGLPPYQALLNTTGYQLFYVDADFLWDYANFLLDGYVKLNFTNLGQADPSFIGFAPSKVMTNLRMRYNWKNRLYVGINAEYGSARHGNVGYQADEETVGSYGAKLPYFVDLGLYGEFLISRKMSVWLKADNLLNMTIQRIPLYPEGGIGFTAGICFNL